ncbi:hypothetical protein H8356DRAFT_1349240 [Neocallimastix lanati (nom. inval.)]|nr:hypothetical protein H8356DRAFT_1349240 [Neocallimastix sp. JGI-2020a]
MIRHKINYEIGKNSILLDLKTKRIFNEVSQVININKQLLPDVTKFDEIPDESKCYKTDLQKNKKVLGRTDKINILIEKYKTVESELIYNKDPKMVLLNYSYNA